MIVGLDLQGGLVREKVRELFKEGLTFDLDPLLLFFDMLSVTYVLRKNYLL